MMKWNQQAYYSFIVTKDSMKLQTTSLIKGFHSVSFKHGEWSSLRQVTDAMLQGRSIKTLSHDKNNLYLLTLYFLNFCLSLSILSWSHNALFLNKTLSNKQVPWVWYLDYSVLILNAWRPGALFDISFPLNILLVSLRERNCVEG